LIYGLGILHVGEETAITLSQMLSNFSHEITKINIFTKTMRQMTLEQLQELSDIGPKVAQSIYNWFREEKNILFLQKLENSGIEIIIEESKKIKQKLSNLTFVLTGSLQTISRDQAKEKIRALGGKISESVSKQTNYVVAGVEAGSKLIKAQELNIKIIDEQEFLNLIK
jgi:DNA ligase (NAD+)